MVNNHKYNINFAVGIFICAVLTLQFGVNFTFVLIVIQDYAAKGSIDQAAFPGFACMTVLVSVLVAWCFRLIERKVLKRADALVLPILI